MGALLDCEQHQELVEGRLAPARRAALAKLGDQAALAAAMVPSV